MSKITIRKIGITKLAADAVVNAANSELTHGGGVCGYIFRDAGAAEMAEACDKIGHCDTGSAVITPGFRLPAKYVIHAVGPIWHGGNRSEPQLLYSAYKKSLLLAKENGLHSIGFPLISAGIYGYPLDQAWRKAIQACRDFLAADPGYEMDITFAVLDDQIKALGEKTLKDVAAEYGAEEAAPAKTAAASVSKQTLQNAYRWCAKYSVLFRVLSEDDDLREFFSRYDAYQPEKGHHAVFRVLHECMKEAYADGVVIPAYSLIIDEGSLQNADVSCPTDTWVKMLSPEQILACIAWHFRRDHFVEGSWIGKSVANGSMRVLTEGFCAKHK